MPHSAIHPWDLQVAWQSARRETTYFPSFQEFFLAFNHKSSNLLSLQRAARCSPIYFPCFGVKAVGSAQGFQWAHPFPRGKHNPKPSQTQTQPKAFPNSNTNLEGGLMEERTPARGCWLRWEPAGCAHQQLMRSSASVMLWSKTKATGGKKKKKKSAFCRVFLQLVIATCLHALTTYKATRIWLLLNCIIPAKKCWTAAFLLEGKTIFLQLTLIYSDRFSSLY